MTSVPQNPFSQIDPEVQELIQREKKRQEQKIVLIASESYCPPAVKEVLSCDFTNLYAEGYPSLRQLNCAEELFQDWDYQLAYQNRYGDRRYYKGCEFANFVEALAIRRMQRLFAEHSKPDFAIPAERIYCNVQPLSGAAANNAVYTAFVPIGGKVMGLNLTHGGHLTHGSPVNRSGKNYQIFAYEVDLDLGRLNYDKIREKALAERPHMIIAGFSAYPLDIDWKELRKIANESGSLLLADISHNAGFILTGDFPNPLGHAHVISFTTHKTLCGPRGAVLVTTDPALAKKIDFAVFPGEQGGPHLNNIAAKAVAFQIAATPAFKELQKNILHNAKVFSDELMKLGLKISLNGTTSHLFLLDLKSVPLPTKFPLKGEIVARILDSIGITCNKNTIPGDTSALNPTAVRFGTTMISQLGFKESHTRKLAQIIHRVLTSIHSYIGNDKVTRGKIEVAVFQSASQEVQKLLYEVRGQSWKPSSESEISPLQKIHEENKVTCDSAGMPLHYGNPEQEKNAVEHSTVLADACSLKVIEVSGEKAASFINEVFSSSLLLKPLESAQSVALNANGNVISVPYILRTSNLSHHRSRYLLIVRPEEKGPLLSWLQLLSDGYVLFEPKDPYANITGPVVVRDYPTAILSLEGPRIESLLKEEFPWFQPLFPDSLIEQKDILIHRQQIQSGCYHYYLLTPISKVESVWKSLGRHQKKYSTIFACKQRIQAHFELQTLPKVGTLLNTEQQNQWVSFKKPYAIGRSSYLAPALQTTNLFVWKEPKYAPLKETCLLSYHRANTVERNLVPFAGWKMPVQYKSIVEEHRIVRTQIGLFDVTHMGTLLITGEQAIDFLELVTSNSVHRLALMHCCYSYLLDPQGYVLDDILIYRLDWDRFMLVVNASNHDKVVCWLQSVAEGKVLISQENPSLQFEGEVHINDLKDPSSGVDQRVDIALQGPKTFELLDKLAEGNLELQTQFRFMAKNQLIQTVLHHIPVLISRTGYTGEEQGVEFYLHPDRALELWNLLIREGEIFGIRACGLGSRDSTRTEAGFPLYGHELSGAYEISPVEAGYATFTKFHKPFFIGRRQMIGQFEKEERAVVRFKILEWGKNLNPGDPVIDAKGQYRGKITSSTIVNNVQIGMALIDAKIKTKGTELKFFPLSHKTYEPEVAKDKMGVKDKVLLPLNGEILSRFADLSKNAKI